MKLKFSALPTPIVRQYQAGGLDSNGLKPEIAISNGRGNPCRHCLQDIPQGVKMLVFAHRPFPDLQPYAEVGPIFLCADECEQHLENHECPELFLKRETVLIKGYHPDNRIFYGTGKIVGTANIEEEAQSILENSEIAYVHIRSATNNCYLARIDRGDD